MSPVPYQPSPSNTCSVKRRIGVAQEQVRTPREYLADVVEAELDAEQCMPVGGVALVSRLVDEAARRGRVLGAPVGPVHLDAQLGGPFGDGGRDARAPEARDRHVGEVTLGEVGVVEQAREEVGRPSAHAEVLGEHQPQHLAWIPDVHQMHRVVPMQGAQQRLEHPDEVAQRRADDRRGTRGLSMLSCLASNPIVRCEWMTPLGSRVVPEVNAMRAGASGSTRAGSSIASASSSAANADGAGGGRSPAGCHRRRSTRPHPRTASAS